jgi:hypothetical protein
VPGPESLKAPTLVIVMLPFNQELVSLPPMDSPPEICKPEELAYMGLGQSITLSNGSPTLVVGIVSCTQPLVIDVEENGGVATLKF